MIKFENELKKVTEENIKGEVKLTLSGLADFNIRNEKLRMFSLAELKPGEEVEFHIHENECEYYYIISGNGLYNDNGKEIDVVPGTITFTPSREGHGIKNSGNDLLKFIALIILD